MKYFHVRTYKLHREKNKAEKRDKNSLGKGYNLNRVFRGDWLRKKYE